MLRFTLWDGGFPSQLWIQVGYFSQASLFATNYFDHPWSFAMVKCVVLFFLFFPHQVKVDKCFCDVSKIHLVSVISETERETQKRDRLTPGHSEVVVPLCWATRTGEQWGHATVDVDHVDRLVVYPEEMWGKPGLIWLWINTYNYIPFLGGWTSIYQLFWCSPGVQGFDTLPYI